MRFKVIIFSVIISILGFLGFYTNSYCEALPDFILDPNSFEVLNGGAFQSQYQYGMTNDVGQMAFVYGVDAALQQINTDLYNKYGWDLQDASWAIEDALLENAGTGQSADTFVSNMSDGAILSWVAANSDNIRLFSSWLVNPIGAGTRKLKQYIMGKVNANNEIIDTYDNTITYVDDDFFDVYQSTYDSLVLSDDIIVLSDSSLPIYGTHAEITLSQNGNVTGFAEYNADYKFFVYTVTQNGYNFYMCVPASQYIGTGNSNSIYRFNGNFKYYSDSHVYQGQKNYFELGTSYVTPTYREINGVGYYFGPITEYANYRWSKYAIGNESEVIDIITNYSDSAYSYEVEPQIAEDMQDTLNLLKGHWVDSDDMQRINEFIGDLPVNPYQPNGAVDYLPFIGATDADLAELQDLIDDILARSQAYDDVLGDPDPTPDPEPEPEPEPVPDLPNQGIDIPPDFPTDGIDTLGDVITSPFNFFSIFEPLFMIFGSSFSMLFGLWLFFPSFILILIIIWTLK